MVVLKNNAWLSILLAVLLAAGLLVAELMAPAKPAQATFPGDNGRIAFSSTRGTGFQIYSVSSSGTEVDLNPVTSTLSGFDYDPAYSPDGTKIAFTRTVGGNKDIWTISSTGGMNTNRITSDPAVDEDPTWSPDGKRIAFSSNRAPASAYQIYSVSSSGTEVDLNPVTTQLTGVDRDPVYSPDGTKIAFQRNVGSGGDIWTISATGGMNTNRITSDPENDITPDYSPDGKRIAFSSDRAPATGSQIYSVSSSGTEVDLNPVTSTLSGGISDPAYSPDGTKIAFARHTGGNWNIWTISSTGGTNTNQITSDPANDYTPSWQSLPTAKPPTPPGNPPANPQANTDPKITNFKPAPNSRIRNRSPLISATVQDAEDNLTKADIKLFVDGNPISGFSYDPTTDKLSYKSDQLSLGGHTIRIVATDTKGSNTQETWSFRVRRNAG